MTWIKFRTGAKKAWLWAKKFWWALVLGLALIVTGLIYLLTKNGAYIATLLDVLDSKRSAHDAEMETLGNIHDAEIAAKNARLKEHEKRRAELEEEFAKRGETLDKRKEAELKRIVDESYNDPERLAKELADAFGLK